MKVIPNDNTGLWEIHDDAGFICKLESESTAQLFSAAPELLSALELAQAYIKPGAGVVNHVIATAIAKATTNERK